MIVVVESHGRHRCIFGGGGGWMIRHIHIFMDIINIMNMEWFG
jgi:hypothetical protein